MLLSLLYTFHSKIVVNGCTNIEKKFKMAEYYRGQFLANRVSKSVETTWVGYYHPYTSPHETDFEMDAWIWRKCKNG